MSRLTVIKQNEFLFSKLLLLREDFIRKITEFVITTNKDYTFDDDVIEVYKFGSCYIYLEYDDVENIYYFSVYEDNEFLVESFSVRRLFYFYDELMQAEGHQLKLKYDYNQTISLLDVIKNKQLYTLPAIPEQFIYHMIHALAYTFMFVLAMKSFSGEDEEVKRNDTDDDNFYLYKTLFVRNYEDDGLFLNKFMKNILATDNILFDVINKIVSEESS